MVTRCLTLLACVISLVILLAACGGDEELELPEDDASEVQEESVASSDIETRYFTVPVPTGWRFSEGNPGIGESDAIVSPDGKAYFAWHSKRNAGGGKFSYPVTELALRIARDGYHSRGPTAGIIMGGFRMYSFFFTWRRDGTVMLSRYGIADTGNTWVHLELVTPFDDDGQYWESVGRPLFQELKWLVPLENRAP